jgi:hypothetical protein
MGLWKKLRGAFSSPPGAVAPDASPGSPDGPEEQFADLVLGLTRRLPYVSSAARHPSKAFTLSISLEEGGEPAELYLGNMFAETRDLSPDARLARVMGLLSAIEPQDPLDWDEAKGLLVPLLRSMAYAASTDHALAVEPFVPFVVLALGIDSDATTQVVTAETLSGWGVPFETARQCAFDVLTNHIESEDVETWDRDTPYPNFTIGRDDSYQSSRLALPGFVASFRGKVNGNPIAIVPHRGLLVIAGDADASAVLRLIDTAEREYRASPRSLSPDLYTVDAADQVVPWEPPPDHPHRRLARRNRLLLAGSEYDQQKEALSESLETLGDEAFVASYTIVMPAGDEIPWSYAVLPEGVATLLPCTDVVVFASNHAPEGKPQHLFVFLDDARRIAGEGFFAVEPGWMPERLRVSRWPDEETLRRLAEVAVELPKAGGSEDS